MKNIRKSPCWQGGGRVVRERHVCPELPFWVGTPSLFLAYYPRVVAPLFHSDFGQKFDFTPIIVKKLSHFFRPPPKAKIFCEVPSFSAKNSLRVPPFFLILGYYPGVVPYTFHADKVGGYPPALKWPTSEFRHTFRSRTTLPPLILFRCCELQVWSYPIRGKVA